jgi:hypothetical protein
MKGVIVICLGDLVRNNFGQDKWDTALEKAGVKKNTVILPTSNVDDSTVLKVIDSVCNVLNISLVQAADAFGDYWVNVFAPKTYAPYYAGVKSAKEFLLNMDKVHVQSAAIIKDCCPPRFSYEWKDDKTLIMGYKSHRGLIDIMVGLIKGVGKYYNEDLKVTKLADDKVKIVFS